MSTPFIMCTNSFCGRKKTCARYTSIPARVQKYRKFNPAISSCYTEPLTEDERWDRIVKKVHHKEYLKLRKYRLLEV